MASCNRNSYLIVIQLYRVRLSQAPAYSCRVGVACFVIHPQLVALGASCEVLNVTARHSAITTTAHFGACALTCTCRSGASGRGGLHRARHGGAAPIFRHREPPRALQPPQQEAAKRFAMVLLLVDKSAAGLGSSSCDARHASIMPRRQRMPGRSMRACASAARERAAQQHSEDAMPHEPL